MSSMGTKIRKLREIREYNQDYMAVKLGISQEQYSYIENKQKNIPTEIIETIALLLGVSEEFLNNFDSQMVIQNAITGVSKNNMSIFELIQHTHKNEINAYLEIIVLLKDEIAELKLKRDWGN